MLKCTCDPSVAAGGRGKGCSAPSQTILLVKGVCFEKMDSFTKEPTTKFNISAVGIKE